MTWTDPQDRAPLPSAPGQVPPFRMAGWLVLPDQNRLVRPGPGDDRTPAAAPVPDIHLEPRLMHVLVCLAARPGAVLSRHELLDTVWDEVVVREEALTHAISQLRRILGDDSRAAHTIETIRKRGYRLLLPVTDVAPDPDRSATTQPPQPPRRSRPIVAASLLATVAVVSLAVWSVWPDAAPDPATSTPPVATQARPVTSLEGSEIFPALSPDGTQLAFSHAARGTDDYDLFVTPVTGGEPRRLTAHPGTEADITWSPSGETLAFIRHQSGRHGVSSIPAAGGRETVLLEHGPDLRGLDWAPSGGALCFGRRRTDDRIPSGFALHELTLPDLGLRPLTTPPPHHDDIMPAYAPDGATVAFVRLDVAGLAAVQLLDLAEGRVRAIGPSELAIQGLTWLPDGRSLVYGCLDEGRFLLKRLEVKTGNTELVQAQRDWVFFPRAARRSGALVYEERKLARDIVALDLTADATATNFLDSTQPDFAPRFSPSGLQVAFLSLRSGRLAIWLCAADGSQVHELSAPRGLTGRRFAWSPDGRRLAATVMQAGILRTCLIEARTGASRLLGDGEGHMIFRAWSHDGSAIMCQMQRQGELVSVRFNLPTGRLDPLVPTAARILGDTAEGCFFCLPGDPDVWYLPRQADPATARAITLPSGTRLGSITCRADGLLFAVTEGEETTVCSLSPTTGRRREIARIAGATGPHLDLSPDGRTLLHERSEVLQVDVMLLPGLR